LLGHSESRCPKLFDHPELETKRAWSPELRAESGRRQGRESRWIRQGGNPNWVAPDPVFMRNKCASSNSGDNGTNHKEVVNANNEKKFERANLADVFNQASYFQNRWTQLQRKLLMRKIWMRMRLMN
jgi:hypothetical protein